MGVRLRLSEMIQWKCPRPRDTPCNNDVYEPNLYVVNGDGSGLRRLRTQWAALVDPSWSADGKTIRFGRYLVQADGSGQTELPRNVPFGGAWSPDGKRFAFAHVDSSPAERNRRQRWTLGRERRRKKPSAGGALRRREQSRVVPGRSPDRLQKRRISDLYVVNADGSGLRRLTRHAENVPRSFAWSPDGRTIAFLHNREVYIVKADGSDERRLTQLND